MSRTRRALLIGCHGGVGRALLSLLQRSAPGRRLLQQLDSAFLVDRRDSDGDIPLEAGVLLPPVELQTAEDLARLVREHRVTEVIDLSSVDTVDCTRVCDELGAHFLCTSVEEWPGRGSIPTDEAIARLLPPRRPALSRRAHLVGSGANPGIVNALVFIGLEEFARRVGARATLEELEIHSVLITEDDTTTESPDNGSTDVFPMTWSPAHCLEELFEPRAFAAVQGQVVHLGHQPTERWYAARCGDRVIAGMAVPHEELVTLAGKLRSVEIGFIYRIPPAARRALWAHPDRSTAEHWPTRRLYPPWTTHLTGSDRVGVLLCSRRFGELWVGYDTSVDMALRLGTNATQLQVAAGVLAGWSQLGERIGIQFVEDLDHPRFISSVSEVLGPHIVVHDATAPLTMLVDRAVHVDAASAGTGDTIGSVSVHRV